MQMDKMKMYTVSSLQKMLDRTEDMFYETAGKAFKNETYCFQIVIESPVDVFDASFMINSDIKDKIDIFEIKNVNAGNEYGKNHDDYVLTSDDKTYPDLIQKNKSYTIKKGKCNSFFVVVNKNNGAGTHNIKFSLISENKPLCSCEYIYEVVDYELPENDLIISHWFYCDCLCELNNVKMFSEQFYTILENYLDIYIEGGSNMLLMPLFTPALDTERGAERLTSQLVKIKKDKNSYSFDFSEAGKFVDIAIKHGIKYFELSHLFTQWGAENCPKIVAEENGVERKIFGWDDSSESEAYKTFLSAYLPKLVEFIQEKGIYNNSYLHLSDEPNLDSAERYARLYRFVKPMIGDLKTMDAVSEYSMYEDGVIDLPSVITNSTTEFIKNNVKYLAYYSCFPCDKYESNRFMSMPAERTRMIGFQIYRNNASGFTHWGFNFWHSKRSRSVINPFIDTSGSGHYVSGDPFYVYPDVATNGLFKSIRFYYMVQAFQDYRAVKLLEKLKGKDFCNELYNRFGIFGYDQYKHSRRALADFRDTINSEIEKAIK